MKISTQKLVPGQVMLTGEIVMSTNDRREVYKNTKMEIVLFNPKNKKTRIALWSLHGTVFVKMK